ncbi:SpaA isopeptide-forming pilin-related protein [Enterococcus sp. AZ103]|uniref:SpaA isopeptide-forming pilin-related protein n=1 Tax=Enterococcus sp. AZ103 TaxID=2774628 RepID=UPI003F249A79
MKQGKNKFIYLMMLMTIILSNILPLTVLAEGETTDGIVQLKDFMIQKAPTEEIEGDLSLQISNTQTTFSEKIISLNEGIKINTAEISEKNPGIVVEKSGEPSSLTAVATTNASSDELRESPIQPTTPTSINQNQLRIVIQPNVKEDISLKLSLTTDQTSITATLDKQQLSASLPVVESSTTEATDTKEETSEPKSSSEETTQSQSSSEETTESSTATSGNKLKKQQRVTTLRAAANIGDLIDQYSPGDRFVTNVVADIPNPAIISQPNSLKINFAVPETVRTQLQIGDYYEFPLPDGLTVENFIEEPLVDPDNPSLTLGKYTIDPVTKMIRITLTDTTGGTTGTFEPLQSGEINVATKFDRQVITQPGINQLIFPTEYQLPPMSIMIQPETATSVSKAGNFDKQINPEKIIWSVDVNKDLSTLTDPVVNETFPTDTTFESAQVFPVQLDFSGNVTSVGNTALTADQYQIDNNGNIKFNGMINQAYRIVYQTKINDEAKPANGGNATFTNNVTFNNLPASASVTASYGKLIEKVQSNYSASNQQYSWTIRYNYGQKQIANGATVTDNFSNNMDVTADDVKLYYMIANPNGQFSRGQLVPDNTYEVNVTSGSPTNKLTVTFNDQIMQNQAIDIVYTSKVNGIVSDDSQPKITNTAETNGLTTTPNISQPVQQAVIKNAPSVEVGSKIANWSVDINRNRYQIKNATFTDTLTQSEKGYVSFPQYQVDGESIAGVEIVDNQTGETLNSQVLLNGQYIFGDDDPDFEVNIVTGQDQYSDTYQYFTVKFLNKYLTTDHSFSMKYQTYYNQFSSSNPPTPQRLNYNNEIEMKWTDQNNNDHEAKSNNGFETTTEEANQGEKSGSYNPVTKEITWTIVANYNNQLVNQFDFNDPITGNQVYLKDSLTITRGIIDNNTGRFEATDDSLFAGEQKNSSYITSSEPTENNNQLAISIGNNQTSIPGGSNYDTPKVFQIQFKTSLKNQIIQDQSSYKNTADITINGLTESLPASVSIEYSNEIVNKSVNYNASTNTINWGLWLNRNQSLLVEPTITDMPSNNQTIDPASINIYQGTVTENGNVNQTSQTLRQGTDYTLNITTDNVSGQQKMVIAFSKDYLEEGQSQTGFIEKPYYISYRSSPNFTTAREQVSNMVNVTTKEGVIPHPDTQQSQTIQITNTSGTAIGEKGSVTVQKNNDEGAVLAGAKLTLTRVFNNETIPEQKLYEVTTDQQGQATFGNLVYTNTDSVNGFRYILKETQAPDGYTISDELMQGVELRVDRNSSQENEIEKIINQPVSLTFNKEDASGQKISGGLFALEKENEQGIFAAYGRPFAAEENGKKLTGLTDGNYRLFEISSPADEAGNLQYLLNQKRLPFSVNMNDTGQRQVIVDGAPVTSLTLTNYRGSARLYKTNEDKQPIANATFSVEWAPLDTNDFSEYQPTTNFVTDEAGVLNLTDLPPGKYQVRESAAPTGYYVNNQIFSFAIQGDASDQAPVPVELNTAEDPLIDYLGNARFTKIDGSLFAETSEQKILAGASFQLYSEDGETPIGTPVTSGEDGYFTFENLTAGTTYQFKEISASTSYLLNQEVVRFTMPVSTEGSPVYVSNSTEKIVYNEATPFKNYQGSAQIQKYSEVDGQDVGLAGAVFAVVNAAGEVVAENIVSQADGIATATGLAPGTYQFKETKAPDGFILNQNLSEKFTIEDATVGQPDIIQVGRFINFKGTIELEKVNDSDQPLAQAQFKLWKIAGSNKTEVQQVVSDSQGKINITGLAPGDYQLQEIKAPDGYIVNDKTVNFTIDSSAVEQKVQKLGKFINYQQSVKFVKENAKGNPLAGAEFVLLDQAGNMLDGTTKWRSDKNGEVTIDHLAPGDYQLKEVKAPTGYLLDTQMKNFTIANNQSGKPETKSLPVWKNYQGSIQLTKINPKGEKLTGATFQLLDDNKKVIKDNLTTNREGQLDLADMAPGSYFFKEVTAPEGYQKSKDLYPVVIEKEAAGEPEKVLLTVSNQPISTPPNHSNKPNNPSHPKNTRFGSNNTRYPQTNDLNSPILWISGMLLVILAGGVYWYRRKNNES